MILPDAVYPKPDYVIGEKAWNHVSKIAHYAHPC